jgi:hypothetical protein
MALRRFPPWSVDDADTKLGPWITSSSASLMATCWLAYLGRRSAAHLLIRDKALWRAKGSEAHRLRSPCRRSILLRAVSRGRRRGRASPSYRCIQRRGIGSRLSIGNVEFRLGSRHGWRHRNCKTAVLAAVKVPITGQALLCEAACTVGAPLLCNQGKFEP